MIHDFVVKYTRTREFAPPILPQKGAPDTAPIIAGVISACAGAVLIALGVYLWRRRAKRKKNSGSQSPPAESFELEKDAGREQTVEAGGVVVDDGEQCPPHQDKTSRVAPPSSFQHAMAAMEADVADHDRTHSRSRATAPSQTTTSPELGMFYGIDATAGAAPGSGAGKGYASERPSAGTSDIAEAEMSAAERAELGQFCHRQQLANGAPVLDESTKGDSPGQNGAASTSGQREPGGSIGLGEAVLKAAENLAYSCQIPGVSEAAAMVATLVNLVADSRGVTSGTEADLRQCRTIVMMLERASKVASQVRYEVS